MRTKSFVHIVELAVWHGFCVRCATTFSEAHMDLKQSCQPTRRLTRVAALATLILIAARSDPTLAETLTTDPWQVFSSLKALATVSDETLARQRGRGATQEISASRQHAVILWDETQKRNQGGGYQ